VCLTLQYLTGVVNLLCVGRALRVVVPHLCGAYLLLCRGNDGGIRPIAVGEVLRRLTSKCAARAVLSNALQLLSPLEVGVGLPGGCDAIYTQSLVYKVTRTSPQNLKLTAGRLLQCKLDRSCHHIPRNEIPSSLLIIMDGMLVWLPTYSPLRPSFYSKHLWRPTG
jgi:hypothetical protein